MYDKHLDCFLMVADLGSFSKAAEHLYISPNAIIKQINLLEQDLGIMLFHRSNHGVKLTEAGQSIYKDAKRIIRISQQAIETAKNIEDIDQRSIRVGNSFLRPCKNILDQWMKISDRYPKIKIQIMPFSDDAPSYLKTIENLGQEIDVIAGIYPSGLWENRCQALQLTTVPIYCAVPYKHPLAEKEELTFQDLYGYDLFMVERGDTSYIDALRDEIEQKHTQIHIIDVPSYDTKIFNQCDLYNTPIISIQHWSQLHPSLRTLPCRWDFTVPYGILYSLTPSKRVEQFVEAMRVFSDIKIEHKKVLSRLNQ